MNELAIITGASRGIGRAAAGRFRLAGWEVWNLSRGECDLDSVENHACDFSDLHALERCVSNLDLKRFSRISIVHNAAVSQLDNYATLTPEDFLRMLTINVVAPQLINRYLIPQLPPSSSILYIGSLYSEKGTRDCLSYATSKHALAGSMRATCCDIGEKFLHTCLIAPGFTETQMLHETVGQLPLGLERAIERTILGRLLAPGEIAELIFFCSMNPSVNGSVIHANLGQKIT